MNPGEIPIGIIPPKDTANIPGNVAVSSKRNFQRDKIPLTK